MKTFDELMALSEGLRLYNDLCRVPMPSEQRENTWYAQVDWVSANVPQESLLALYTQFWTELSLLSEAWDDTLEGQLANAISDACDVIWRAMNIETLTLTEAFITARLREELAAQAGQPGGDGIGKPTL